MPGTVAPGKQRVIVFKKQKFLVMESSIIDVVGRKRGGGDGACGLLDRTVDV